MRCLHLKCPVSCVEALCGGLGCLPFLDSRSMPCSLIRVEFLFGWVLCSGCVWLCDCESVCRSELSFKLLCCIFFVVCVKFLFGFFGES